MKTKPALSRTAIVQNNLARTLLLTLLSSSKNLVADPSLPWHFLPFSSHESLLDVSGQGGKCGALPWLLGEPPDSLTSEKYRCTQGFRFIMTTDLVLTGLLTWCSINFFTLMAMAWSRTALIRSLGVELCLKLRFDPLLLAPFLPPGVPLHPDECILPISLAFLLSQVQPQH